MPFHCKRRSSVHGGSHSLASKSVGSEPARASRSHTLQLRLRHLAPPPRPPLQALAGPFVQPLAAPVTGAPTFVAPVATTIPRGIGVASPDLRPSSCVVAKASRTAQSKACVPVVAKACVPALALSPALASSLPLRRKEAAQSNEKARQRSSHSSSIATYNLNLKKHSRLLLVCHGSLGWWQPGPKLDP